MHAPIATPLGKRRLILRPGSTKALQLPTARFEELRAPHADTVPPWLADAVYTQWDRKRRDACDTNGRLD